MARTKIYIPRETAAVSVGADEVAIEIARQAKSLGEDIELIRNGLVRRRLSDWCGTRTTSGADDRNPIPC